MENYFFETECTHLNLRPFFFAELRYAIRTGLLTEDITGTFPKACIPVYEHDPILFSLIDGIGWTCLCAGRILTVVTGE